ncbi:uncharacterized protein YALI1_B24446g [Yarrowia lipolytica]|uniref:Uncharacterized protein n=1 Tax=Yarrowia lipolytica TaxID=4952 RepID=A0A1D8N8E2_YARLL|nr:hypothetical protein YALI1_B24446g [Yarrowia lipolytica]
MCVCVHVGQDGSVKGHCRTIKGGELIDTKTATCRALVAAHEDPDSALLLLLFLPTKRNPGEREMCLFRLYLNLKLHTSDLKGC